MIECRVTLCEIQAYAYTEASPQIWQNAIAGIAKQPWGARFESTSSVSSEENGRMIIVTLLGRRAPR